MASTSTDDQKMIVLKSFEGETFEVKEIVAKESQTLSDMIEDCPDTTTIPIPNVTSKILAKVLEYCNRHVTAKDGDDLAAFDSEYMKVDMETLYGLIMAANYLNIKNLLDLTCKTVADLIKGKTPEEIRKTFNIKNDFTPEEEKKIREENAWAFE